MPLRALHVIRSLDPLVGGPSHALEQMVGALRARGVEVDVATTAGPDELDALPAPGTPTMRDGVRHFLFANRSGGRWSWSPAFSRWLRRHIGDYQLIHITGVFTYPVVSAARIARRAGVPYIFRPAGTLDAYSRAQKAWKKRIFHQLVLRPLLRDAALLHATSAMEREQLGLLGLADHCAVLPLAVELPERPAAPPPPPPLEILFLSRVHPKKGLPVLFRALARLRDGGRPFRLTIAGEGEAAYLAELRALADTLGLTPRIHFAGFVEGEAKAALLARSHLLALPSYQENFGVAVAEALAAGLPVVVSDQVALSREVAEAGAGAVVPVDRPDRLAEAIDALFDEPRRRRDGAAARRLVEERFSSAVLGRELEALYRRIANSR